MLWCIVGVLCILLGAFFIIPAVATNSLSLGTTGVVWMGLGFWAWDKNGS